MASYDPMKGFLSGIRVLQYTDEKGDYTGRLLHNLGADVIMVEPPGGSPSRRIGPFYHDEAGPENSLFHWQYNLGKRSVALDLATPKGQEGFKTLAATADVLVESMAPGHMASLSLGYDQLKGANPGLVFVSITPFGQTGPWRDLKASDLVHLALGGEMNYTRYPAHPDGTFDKPPIAGQMWQSYHFTGDYAVHSVLAALIFRMTSGQGQYIDVPIHQVMSISTEIDYPTYVYMKQPIAPWGAKFEIGRDGRYGLGGAGDLLGAGFAGALPMLKKYGMAGDLEDPKYQDRAYRARPEVQEHINELITKFLGKWDAEEGWHKGQGYGLLWASVRKPEDNLTDPHWAARSTFAKVEHPEIQETLTYAVGRWHSPDAPWQAGPRAPRIGEHTDSALKEAMQAAREAIKPANAAYAPQYSNPSGRKMPLEGVRVLDFTQLLATAGGTKILSSLGAECIRVEWKDRLDMLRDNPMMKMPGGPPGSHNRSGYFNDINAGRMGISLNMQSPKGKEIFARLLRMSDVIAEGYRSDTMERWGLGYEALKKIKPDIVYVQQPGFGKKGPHGSYGSVGPVANAISGITDMSGLPEPYSPRGWLYSFMDFGGGYNCALAQLAGIYYKKMTGKGIFIDSSQIEPGIYYSGTPILDYQVNGRHYSRTGNRSPNLAAAPHGAYKCKGPASVGTAGPDRWIAISCYDQQQWQGLCKVLGDPAWTWEARFATLAARYKNQDALDAMVNAWTAAQDVWDVMDRLQKASVPSGVVQTIQDRLEKDPQLKHLGWVTDLPHIELGTYPVKAYPAHLSATPAYQGGTLSRAAPGYGEDNQYVYGTLLGMSEGEIKALQGENVI